MIFNIFSSNSELKKITYFRHEAVNNEYGEKSLKLQQQLFY